VQSGKNVIVAASGNSLRPMIQYLEQWDDATTASAEIGLCTPYIYTFEGEKIVKKEVREVPGIITKGASTTEVKVESGRV
jgi:bisphosphoglycerate-dependent phosphoglycerate mutase